MVSRTGSTAPLPVAIVGAGMTGLTAARRLAGRGHTVHVFDKGRGLGGRLATRRRTLADGRALAIDHGAQFATARTPHFHGQLAGAAMKRGVTVWRPTAGRRSDPGTTLRFVGLPGMGGLVHPLADGLPVNTGHAITGVRRDSDGWWLDGADRPQGPFAAVILTVPAPQLPALLPPGMDHWVAALRTVSMAPCWAGLFAFDRPLAMDGAMMRPSGGPLNLVVSMADKPGRPSLPAYVVHAHPNWSTAHLEQAAETVLSHLHAALAECVGAPLPTSLYADAHRWRYARTMVPLGRPFLASDTGLFAGGDWTLGARVEAAFESGRALANAVEAHLP
ncbi:NAD(P)/FAD-dependent oxidoreductase [Yunchengibacter salinarum]|uniref:NAD(P)/FAD-dependent oxidoreductase n=1 Tax=Yunchengibacter salinarum TaxID=3133399 RepID=UPI0035B5893F